MKKNKTEIEQQNQEDSKINDFKDLFHDEISKNKLEKSRERSIPKFAGALIFYALVILVLSSIIGAILLKAYPDKFIDDISSSENVYVSIIENNNSIYKGCY